MLLRIDKVAGGNNPSDPQPSSDAPLHACLATAPVPKEDANSNINTNAVVDDGGATQGGSQLAPPTSLPKASQNSNGSNGTRNGNSNANTGEILTVGRKNCIVTIDDKCCSRSHATISLLSNRPITDEEAASSRELLGNNNDNAMMEFGSPSTPEEIGACNSSPDGVICVIKDRGSKFGTYISVDEELIAKYGSNGNDNADAADGGDGDETGDETDDEGNATKQINYVELSEKQARAVRLLSNNDSINDPNNALALPKFQKLEANQSIPLLQLSHSSSTSSSSSSKSSHYAIILFGPQGSAIRLSLLQLQFTFSRIKKPVLDPLLSSLHYIGATHSSQWEVDKSTHLVAPDKTAAAKGIMAWACRKPAVVKGYIEALLRRRDASEALPEEKDFCPSGTWDAKLKWTPEPSTALKGYRIAVMINDDNAPLAASAGASILFLHEAAPTSTHTDFEAWWANQCIKANAEKLAMVVVSSTSKKCKKLNDWLKHDENVRFTNSKNIAKAITNNEGMGELLLDTKKVVIEKIHGWDAAAETGKATVDSVLVGAETSKTAARETVEKPEEDVSFEPANDDYQEDEVAEEEMPVSTRRKRRQEAEENGGKTEQEEVQHPERQKRRRKNKEEEAEAVPEEEEAPVEVGAPAEEDAVPDKSTTKKSNKTKTKPKIQQPVEESSDDEPGLPSERVPLPVTEDGWLVAAPKKRKAYRKEIEETEDKDVPDTAAETEKVGGLIVRKYVPPKKMVSASVATSGNKKKDFKRFRKNHVRVGYTSFNPTRRQQNSNAHLPKVRLRDTLPKESERQRQLQQQQADLEREQELADQLFNDVGAKSARKRGKGSLDAFMTKSTAKRGRGRR